MAESASKTSLDKVSSPWCYHIMKGCSYKCLKGQEGDHHKENHAEEGAWSALSNRVAVPLIDQLLTHVARRAAVGSTPAEDHPAFAAEPPSLSPIKRKTKGDKEAGSNPPTPNQDAKTSAKTAQKEKEKETKKEKYKKDGLGTFYTFPNYLELYEVLKGAYSSYKTSLDLMATDKFCAMLKTTLPVLSQILEVATLSDIGKYAEMFLNYLRTTVSIEPTDTVLCVQQDYFHWSVIQRRGCESAMLTSAKVKEDSVYIL